MVAENITTSEEEEEEEGTYMETYTRMFIEKFPNDETVAHALTLDLDARGYWDDFTVEKREEHLAFRAEMSEEIDCRLDGVDESIHAIAEFGIQNFENGPELGYDLLGDFLHCVYLQQLQKELVLHLSHHFPNGYEGEVDRSEEQQNEVEQTLNRFRQAALVRPWMVG